GTGIIMAVPDHGGKNEAELAPQLIAPFIDRNDPAQLLFGPEDYVMQAEIEQQKRDGETLFNIAHMSPWLISYRRGRTRNLNKLGQSNLCAYWEFLSEDKTRLVPKNSAFIKWAKKVFAWIRMTPEELACNGYLYPATTRVKEAVDKGQLEV